MHIPLKIIVALLNKRTLLSFLSILLIIIPITSGYGQSLLKTSDDDNRQFTIRWTNGKTDRFSFFGSNVICGRWSKEPGLALQTID